jgi:sec-independent protein translocase protein TatA
MPFGFHPIWLVILLVIVLIIFGPGKLPELGGAVGRGIREFRKTSSDITDEIKTAVHEPEKPVTTTATATEPAKASEKASEPAKTQPEKTS